MNDYPTNWVQVYPESEAYIWLFQPIVSVDRPAMYVPISNERLERWERITREYEAMQREMESFEGDNEK